MKLLYLMAVVLSAIIVIAYLSWKAVIKPPPVAEISPAETQAQAGENTVHTPAPSSTQGDFAYVRKDHLGDEEYEWFKKYDIGDIIGIKGEVFRTQKGQISVLLKKFFYLLLLVINPFLL